MKSAYDWIRSTYRRFENPLLMKELRQTVRSRIYVYVFMTILFICFFIMSLFLLMQQGEARSSYGVGATSFLILFVPFYIVALLGVPMTAFLSQLQEMEQDCLELIQVTNLTTGQIIRGKIYAGVVKLLLFLTALIPFFAFSYLLRGISIVSILVPLGFTVLLSTLLVSIYVCFSMLVHGGFSKVMSILFLVAVSSLLMYFSFLYLVTEVLRHANFTSGMTLGLSRYSMWENTGIISMALVIWGSLLFLFHQSSIAMAMKSTKNRSWPIRFAYLVLLTVFLVIPFIIGWLSKAEVTEIWAIFTIIQWPLFAILALVWVTEKDRIPRTVAEADHWYMSIPYFSRMTLPGGVWGYHFTILCCFIILGAGFLAFFIDQPYGNEYAHDQSIEFLNMQLAICCYFLFYGGIAHYIGRGMRAFWPQMMLRTVRGLVLVGLVVTMIGPLMVLGLTGFMLQVDTLNVFTMFNPFFMLEQINKNENWTGYLLLIAVLGAVLWCSTFVTGRKILQRAKLDV